MPFTNRVRLPFYLSKPQYPVDEEIYLKANGKRVVLKAIISKEYQGATDWMPAELHERLAIALRHDSVNVEGSKVTAGIRISGSYDIEWIDFLNYPIAPAKFKAFEEAFAARSTRCDICQPVSLLALQDDLIFGIMYEGATYQINVSTNDSICCDTPVFSLVSWDNTIIDSINIDQDGLVTFTLNTPIASYPNAELFVYQVSCNDQTDTATVTGTINGTLSALCPAPENLHAIVICEPLNVEFIWDDTIPTPTDGFDYILKKVIPFTLIEQTVASGNTALTSIDFGALDNETRYKFYVKAICEAGVSESALRVTVVDTPAVGCSNLMTIQLTVETIIVADIKSYTVKAEIINPGGVTLTGDIIISGILAVSDDTYVEYPFDLTLVAGNTSDQTDVIATRDTSGGDLSFGWVVSAAPVPTSEVGSDTFLYTLVLTF